jgi:hypothetical protein
MKVVKVVSLEQPEMDLLINSGKLLVEIQKGLQDGSIEELNSTVVDVVRALKDVITMIVPQ